MANFPDRNARLCARRRYLTDQPFSDGPGLSAGDRLQDRWHYRGNPIGAAVVAVFTNVSGLQLDAPNITGVQL